MQQITCVNTHFKNPEAQADNLITATMKVISWFEIYGI